VSQYNADDMVKLYQSGVTIGDLAKRAGLSYDAVRNRIRRHTGALKVQTQAEQGGISGALKAIAAEHNLSEGELRAVLSSAKGKPRQQHRRTMPTESGSFKALVISDTHIGHERFIEPLFESAVAASKDCDFVLHPGDHLEGMSGRPGHIYELSHIGYQAQIEEARRLYDQFEIPIYGIDGNHDQWYKQKNNAGVVVGAELEKSISNYTHLGEWEGNIEIGGIVIKLFHANDGSAYSTSYKSQKLIESFTGGEKPHLVFSGHYHKALYHFIRNVHTFESGTLCGQTGWMRGKKIAAHTGYWVVTVYHGKKGVARIVPEFVPYYE